MEALPAQKHGEEDADDESAIDIPQQEDPRENEASNAQPRAEYVIRRQSSLVDAAVPFYAAVGTAVAVAICTMP